MLYRITKETDAKLQVAYDKALKELNEFYGINWVRNLPRLIIVNDRDEIDSLFGKKTEGWVIGWSEGNNIYVLDKGKFCKESSHKQYSDDEYAMLIKHEMSHSFSSILAKGEMKPKWLWEGLAIYTSGQNSLHTRPADFKKFLEYFDKGGKELYSEAGFVIDVLINKFGKQKVLDLVKDSSKFKSNTEFSSCFMSIFGFEPTYVEFNRLLNS